MNNKKVRTTLFFTVLTVVLILYRDMVAESLPFIVFSVVCGLGALCMDTAGRFLYITVLLPFCRGLPYSEMMLIVLIAEAVFAVASRKKIKGALLFLPLLLICAIELVDYVYFSVASMEIVYLLAYMVFVTYAIAQKVYRGQEERYIYYFGLTTILAILSVMIQEVDRYGWDYIFTYNLRFQGHTVGLVKTNFNANELGLYCAMANASLLILYHHTKKVNLLCLAAAVSVLGFLSVSRTFILVACLTWAIYILTNSRQPKRVLVIAGMLTGVMLAVVILAPDVVAWMLEYIVNRFGEENTRMPLLLSYFNMVFSSFWSSIFGFSQSYLYVLAGHVRGAVHNGLQEVLVCWGVFGFAIFFGWVAELYRHAFGRTVPKQKINCLSIIVFWLYIQTLQLVTMHNYLTVMFLTVIPLSMGEIHNEQRIGGPDKE